MSTIVHEITHKVHKFLRKYISFCVVFWKKYDTKKKNSATTDRDKFHVSLDNKDGENIHTNKHLLL